MTAQVDQSTGTYFCSVGAWSQLWSCCQCPCVVLYGTTSPSFIIILPADIKVLFFVGEIEAEGGAPRCLVVDLRKD